MIIQTIEYDTNITWKHGETLYMLDGKWCRDNHCGFGCYKVEGAIVYRPPTREDYTLYINLPDAKFYDLLVYLNE